MGGSPDIVKDPAPAGAAQDRTSRPAPGGSRAFPAAQRLGMGAQRLDMGAEPLDPAAPRLDMAASRLRRGAPLLALPLTLAGYLVLGLVGWQLLRHAGSAGSAPPPSVAVDLQDLGEGAGAPTPAKPPPAPAPAPPPALAGPPPGAIIKADAPPAPVPLPQEAVPDRPPDKLPAADLSGVAFGPGNGTTGGGGTGTGGVPGGTGSGPGSGSGGGGAAPRVEELEASQVVVLFRPEFTYPALAKARRIQGAVRVEFTVGADGVPLAIHVVEGPALLQPSAAANAAKYRFRPEIRNGVPVISHFFLNILYQLN
jgi:TonB family protein